MARLAQTSIRFKRFEIGEERFRELGPQIDGVAERVTREIYGLNVEVDVTSGNNHYR